MIQAAYLSPNQLHFLSNLEAFLQREEKPLKSSIPKLKQSNKKSPVASALYKQQFTKLQ